MKMPIISVLFFLTACTLETEERCEKEGFGIIEITNQSVITIAVEITITDAYELEETLPLETIPGDQTGTIEGSVAFDPKYGFLNQT